jgi:hypothetical protein
MTTGVATSPSEYITNTDETDALALDVAADLGVGESVGSAACELRNSYTRQAAPGGAFPQAATVASNVVTQQFDATVLAPGHYEWIWNVTLNTGATRSYSLVLKVLDHD